MQYCSEVTELVRKIRVTDDEKSLIFKAAVIIIIGLKEDCWNEYFLKQKSQYGWMTVHKIVSKLRSNSLLVDGVLQFEYKVGTIAWEVELTLFAGFAANVFGVEYTQKTIDQLK